MQYATSARGLDAEVAKKITARHTQPHISALAQPRTIIEPQHQGVQLQLDTTYITHQCTAALTSNMLLLRRTLHMIRCLHHCDVKLLQTSTKSTRQRTTSPTLTPISPTQFPEPGDGVTSVHQARHAIGLNHSACPHDPRPDSLSLSLPLPLKSRISLYAPRSQFLHLHPR
jgi:hypothetical protein